MNRTLLITAASAFVMAAPVSAQTLGAPTSAPRIVTSGEGQVRVVPDEATIVVGVRTRGATAAAAGNDNARRQKAILDTLKAMGIPAEQISTQNYSVNPEMRYEPNGPGRVTGYTVSNTVRVELKRIAQVAPVIDAALAKGANEIGGVQFSVSNVADARRTAMSEAVRNARADAEALARAAGGTLGALVELSSATPMVRPMYAAMAMDMSAKVERAQTPIEPGEQTINANVSAVWQFIPGSGR